MKLGSERRDGRGTPAGLRSADCRLCEQGRARGPRGTPRSPCLASGSMVGTFVLGTIRARGPAFSSCKLRGWS